MDNEEKELLEKTLELTEENNKILHTLRRAHRFSVAFATLKWVVVLGLTLGAYYYLQPFLEQLIQVYSGLGDIYNSSGSLFGNFREALNQ